MFLVGDLAAKLVLRLFLLGEDLVAPGLEARKALVEPLRSPRSSHTVARVRFERKRRSWLMSTTALLRDFSSASSHSIVGRSRWFVGSSSMRMSGSGASVCASATRTGLPAREGHGWFRSVKAECFDQVRAA